MIRALVLCGGESRRMGKDKGLLAIGKDNWALNAAHKLEQLNLPLSISINPRQQQTYVDFFPAEQLIIDTTGVKGPLQGLLSAYLKYPDDDFLVLACDMTEMDADTLKFLLDIACTFPDHDYYVYTREDIMEPLSALYRSSALKDLYQQLENGSLNDFSLGKLIKKGNYKSLPIHNIQTFNNHNTLTNKFLI